MADWKNLATPSDARLLAELGHREKIRIVERLSAGEAKQKELVRHLGAKSGTVSRWIADLVEVRLIVQDREGSHEPYRLVRPEQTNELLDLAAELASELAEAHSERVAWQAKIDRKRLVERRRRK